MPPAATWHHGLVARWWAEFNLDGPEIAFFRALIEGHGEPALDVGCGTGRLLLPLLRGGMDVDGVDLSADMLALCRRRAEREALAPRLYEQPMHELDLPRRYRTIFLCGAFGIGGVRQHDTAALTRFRQHLESGGLLAIDLPGAPDAGAWQAWAERMQARTPHPWPKKGERRVTADGTVLELRSRLAGVDPAEGVITRQIRVGVWRDDRLLDQEEYALKQTVYSEAQLRERLEVAGFSPVRGVDGYRSPDLRGATAAVRVVLASA